MVRKIAKAGNNWTSSVISCEPSSTTPMWQWRIGCDNLFGARTAKQSTFIILLSTTPNLEVRRVDVTMVTLYTGIIINLSTAKGLRSTVYIRVASRGRACHDGSDNWSLGRSAGRNEKIINEFGSCASMYKNCSSHLDTLDGAACRWRKKHALLLGRMSQPRFSHGCWPFDQLGARPNVMLASLTKTHKETPPKRTDMRKVRNQTEIFWAAKTEAWYWGVVKNIIIQWFN